jgi:hypothetical protein
VTVEGPHGPVDGAIVVQELHMDGAVEDKTFAPGYGEFLTGGGGDLEALALATPTDALTGAAPAELAQLFSGAVGILDAVQADDWGAASKTVGAMATAWDIYRTGGAPPLIDVWMSDALGALAGAVAGRDPVAARRAAFDVAQTGLNLQLRYRSPAEIDLARFDLWVRQLLVDGAAGDPGAVAGDAATLEWIRDRFAHTLSTREASQLDALLGDIRAAADAGDFAAATAAGTRLRDYLASR